MSPSGPADNTPEPADETDRPAVAGGPGEGGDPTVDTDETCCPPASETSTASSRRRMRRVALVVAAVVVLAAIGAAVIRVPYYRFSPGSLYATETLVTVDGSPSYLGDGGGQIDFTTVSSKKASVLDYLLAGLDESVELKPADEFEQGRTPEENRQENLEMMVSSKQMAEVA